ncbi:hypothetical protein [Lewinella sp. W8]|uniref:hypothetical protein n=1 Tax=Lewinella sp. W8 TaxID=2528208 RepID=UPI001067A4AE|nr:hypothetical protein [Lewinella sp. W8]MTB53528.1 hypothetical protein [Lewinella sp. W8]
MKKSALAFVWIYGILAFLFFGGMLFTIITQYPNWDHNLPDSLVTTNNFYAKADPGTFFQLFGKINIPVFIITIVVIWKYKKARNILFGHFLTFFLIGFGTGTIIYPILYELGADNIATRPMAEIEALLARFKTLDAIRAVIALLSISFLTWGMIEFHKQYFAGTAEAS